MLYMTPATEMSLFEELWQYFSDKYFSSDLPYLENISVRSSQVIFYKLIIVGLSIGLIIAALCNLFNKRYVGNFIRKMLKEECFDRERAKTLEELGYQKSLGISWVIKSGGSLTRWVRCAEEDDFFAELENKRQSFSEAHSSDKKSAKFKEPQFKRDLKTMHFYIPEEKKYAADIKFDAKGANVIGVIFVTVAAIAFCLIACYMLSDIIKLFDNFISVMSNNK